MRYLLFSIALVFNSTVIAQRLSSDWTSKTAQQIANYQACKQNSGNSECIDLIGESLHSLYQLNDFYQPKAQRYMSVSEISETLKKDSRWRLLGHGYEQSVLEEAQTLANNKRAVVAIYINQDMVGQLAYILPGALASSGSWGMKVPNSYALISDHPEKSYSEKGLSYSFPRRLISEILIYGREQ